MQYEAVTTALGILGSCLCLLIAQSAGQQLSSGWRVSWSVSVAMVVVGGVTGYLMTSVSPPAATVAVIMAILLVIQTPLDIAFRRLWRTPTLVATGLLQFPQIDNVRESGWWSGFLRVNLQVLLIFFCFAAVHRLSRQSLGFGDVLIIVPAGLAVAISMSHMLVWWLFLAAVSGAVHGIIKRHQQLKHIPFAPHILIPAWAISVLSL